VTRRKSQTLYKVAVDFSWNFSGQQMVTLSYAYPGQAEKRFTRKRARWSGQKTRRRAIKINNVFLHHEVVIRAYLGRDIVPGAHVDEFVFILNGNSESLIVAQAQQLESYDTYGDGLYTTYEGKIDCSYNFAQRAQVGVSYLPASSSAAGTVEMLPLQTVKGSSEESGNFSVTIPNSVAKPRLRIMATSSDRDNFDSLVVQDTEVALRRETALGTSWAKTYGAPSYDMALSIEPTSDGGVIWTGNGSFRGSEYMDLWVVKMSLDGTPEWQKTFGNGAPLSFERGFSVQEASDGGYVVAGQVSDPGGSFLNDDALILKLTASGEVEWYRAYGNSSMERAHSIEPTADGGYVVAGFYTFPFDPKTTLVCDDPGSDMWVFKLDADGRMIWQKAYGTPALIEKAHSIQQTSDGGYIVSGYTRKIGCDFRAPLSLRLLKLNANGEVMWSGDYGASGNSWLGTWSSVVETEDGGFVVSGTAASSLATYHGADLMKVDRYGAVLWHKKFLRVGLVDKGDVTFTSIQKTKDGGFLVSGATEIGVVYDYNAEPDALLVKFNPDGVMEWTQTFGGPGADVGGLDEAWSATQTDDGYLVAGFTGHYGAGETDAWILNVDVDGTVLGLSDEPGITPVVTTIVPVGPALRVTDTMGLDVSMPLLVEDPAARVSIQQQAP
jgi:hypothetical protein